MPTVANKITVEQMIDLLPKNTYLNYVERNDSLDDHLDTIQECIHQGSKDALWEKTDEWFHEGSFYAEDEYLKELSKDMQSKFDIEEDEAKAIIDYNRDELQQAIWDRDKSTPTDDLIRNTGDQVVFYDLDMYIEDYSNDLDERIKDVKKALKIKMKDKTYDDAISMMCQQASYGGRLVVYAYVSLNEVMDLGKFNRVTFNNPMVAIIDMNNGSGDHTELGHSFTVPFDKENMFLCKTFKYSYTYSVCGMSSNWCDSTQMKFSTRKARTAPAKSGLHGYLSVENQYKKVFAAGKCSAGDMDMNRHRKTVYINNFPCGTHCKDCGTFWID